MSTQADLITSETDALKQFAAWYAQQGYEVSVNPRLQELPEFLRTLAPDMIARRNGENVIVEIKTSSPGSLEKIQELTRALEHRAGWKLQVVYIDLADPEWAPPAGLPAVSELLVLLENPHEIDDARDKERAQFLVLWPIIEAGARHRLAARDVPLISRISSSALIKMLLTEGIIEEQQYAVLRRGLAVRNALAHGFLNQPIEPALYSELRGFARTLLGRRASGTI